MRNSSPPVVLTLDDVTLNFRSKSSSFDHGIHHILDSVSMELYEGETLGIIGRNGCGKTTILRLMAGILAPTSGVVTLRKGCAVNLLSIGLGFKPNLSGRDNALLSAMLQGADYNEAVRLLEEIREFSELGDSFDEPVKTYSAGMRSRLGFTTALMTKVDILLIDEVLSVGDAQFKAKAGAALKERITGNQTVVFVSHAAPEVRNLCTRVIWLDQGKIAASGDSDSVLKAYQESNSNKSSHVRNVTA